MSDIETLIEKVKKYNPECNVSRIKSAFEFAKKAHCGQLRKSGEPFMVHPIWVANALIEYKADEDSIIASFLHDVVEDTQLSIDVVRKKFGSNVAFLVNGVTKVKKEVKKLASMDRKKETLRKLISTIARDQRVLLIKLLDRVHNMQTIRFLSQKKQQKIANETLLYSAPRAKRISLWQIKTTLENLCFKVLKPVQYARYQKTIAELAHTHRVFFAEIKKNICKAFALTNIPITVQIYVLSPFEIQKLKQKNIDIRKNFFEIIICTDSVDHCYAAMGVIHKLWKPVLKFFYDFIAVPKDNHYQAIHTSVLGNKGRLLKILIQTNEMNLYSRKSAPFDHDSVHSLKASLLHLDENGSSESYLKSVKDEVFCDHVHFFDYRGNSYKLPQGASMIDLYFHLQERRKKLPHGGVAAIVNDRMMPLKSVIQSDDVINFVSSNGNQKISPFYLRYAKTSVARKRILNSLSHLRRKDAICEGRKIIMSELKRTCLPDLDKFSKREVSGIIRTFEVESPEDFFDKLGRGKIDTGHAVYAFYVQSFMRASHKQPPEDKQYIAVRIFNSRNRVGFVKDIVDVFQRLKINIHEIKGYSPKMEKVGIVDLKFCECASLAGFRDVILPLCNALEQVENVSSVLMDFSSDRHDN
jgi:guanosine-3',5'-bis(diphosphate) 3'-pyrophosphohydrolase